MDTISEIYDVVIIGSGMGALACANILAQEGKHVIVLEKNRQIGGNLQVFSRGGAVFDTGVHYIGGLDHGQVLYKLFRYFGIYDQLRLKRMNEDGFDRIHFKKENIYYHYGIGYDNFKNRLCDYFPDEKQAIEKYCSAIQSIVQKLPLAQLKDGDDMPAGIDFTLSAKDFINGITDNKQLQKVLSGNNALYAGSYRTPFYVHALVLHYYIESSWRCVDGASQIAKYMAREIKKHGGKVRNRAAVISGEFENGKLVWVNLANGEKIYGKHFISNVHPAITIDILGEKRFKPAYVERIKNLKNTEAMFVLHIVLNENSFEYINYNIFQVDGDDVWNLSATGPGWPSFYMVSVTPSYKNSRYATGISVICGMDWKEVEPWFQTHNTVTNPGARGAAYAEFKKQRCEKVIDAIQFHFPDIRSKIKSYSCSTPLTQRDYTASPYGSGYGIEKDASAPFKTMVHTKTSIPNLYLTGQNITLHGVLGVSLSALATCFNLVDKTTVLEKINKRSNE
ncbi:MAG TPA: NAD(P)/FAD-dependent oxidoreductase [Flavobacteriales bacterium]|nr:NAD(P)/FAD-dependent oxidoreductase [Flavobacteriales bacterium]